MRSRLWTSRGLAVAGILTIHGIAITVMMLSRPEPVTQPKTDAILVTLVIEQTPRSAPAPKVPLQQAQLPAPVIPVVTIDLSENPPPTAITVARVAEGPAPGPAGDADAPITATTVEYLRPPVVVYPLAAKRAHASGTVEVRALVETDGQVRDAQVHHSSGFQLLDRAACDSVRKALFKPYMLNGAPRSALVVVPISFGLTLRTASR